MTDQDPEEFQPLVNPLPPVVVILALAILAVELLLAAAGRGFVGGPAGAGWRLEAIESFGFFPAILDIMIETRSAPLSDMIRPFSYSLVHHGLTHAVFVIVFLLALGKLVGEVMGSVAVLATYFGAAVFGALIFAGLSGSAGPLVGGFPAVYGLIGSYTFILWVSYGSAGESQWRAFTLIGLLLGLQLVFGLLFGSNRDWVAEVAGFGFGFAAAPIVSRGGFQRLLARLRQR